MTRTALLSAILALALVAGPFARDASAQDMGRLFLTPEQRTQLETRRKARVPDKPAAAVVESPFTRVDGSVRRSGGRSTVWINGEPVPESTHAESVRLLPRGAGKDQVSVSVGEARQRVELRPGETFDRGSGQVHDVIGGGEIKIKRGDGATR